MTSNEFYCDAEENDMVRCKDQCMYCLKKELKDDGKNDTVL